MSQYYVKLIICHAPRHVKIYNQLTQTCTTVSHGDGDSNSLSPPPPPKLPSPLFSLCRSLPMRVKQKAGPLALGSIQDQPCRSGIRMLKNVALLVGIVRPMGHCVNPATSVIQHN